MLFTVPFPSGLLNVEYLFFDAADAAINTWSSVGVVARSFGRGYAVSVEPPAGAASIAWRASEVIDGETIPYSADAAIEAPAEPVDFSPVLDAIAQRPTLAQMRAAHVRVQAPVLESGEILLNRGDAYKAVDGRAVTFEFEGGLVQVAAPRLATVALMIEGAPWTQLGAVATTTDGLSCAFELSAAQTAALNSSSCKYFIRAATIAGDSFDLAEGEVTIRPGSE